VTVCVEIKSCTWCVILERCMAFSSGVISYNISTIKSHAFTHSFIYLISATNKSKDTFTVTTSKTTNTYVIQT